MTRHSIQAAVDRPGWQQRDPALLPRLLLSLVALLLLWPGLHFSELNPGVLFDRDSTQAMGTLLHGAWPPAHNREFLELLWQSTLETLAIAMAGIALALPLAFAAALLVTRALSRSALHRRGHPSLLGRGLRLPVRALLVLLRSVPEIVWALLFVRAVGLGPTAGVLAITITYVGMLGKVYGEIFESVDRRPAEALIGAGASRFTAFLYGVLPNAAGEMLSYTVYRWECALRASVVMGFVGAGGLGQQLELSLRMFAGNEVVTILLVFLLLVLIADQISRLLRSRLL
ncbi:PhnE/PtxC family ABC transporter permease [Microbulbifer mangrovi]|uniref:PhnE/PtxC family ABC transporter permease n=1 Tax=Microbulbifer mangrovi TaxID=927787 RepID=UPI00099049D5|nr:ABC transporter permease subunit [Microbulbifer mangrovi]